MSKKNKGRAATVGCRAPSKTIDQPAASRQETDPQSANKIYYEERLMNAAQGEVSGQVCDQEEFFEEEEEEEQDDDERHQLIARDDCRSGGGGSARGHSNAQPNNRKDRDHSQPVMFSHENKNPLGGLFSSAFARFVPQKQGSKTRSSLYDHRADFVYQTNWADGDEEMDQSGQQRAQVGARNNRAYQSNDDVKLASPSGGRNNQGSHWALTSRRRTLVSNALLLALAVSICVLLVKLSFLVREERRRLMGDSSFEAGRQADLVEELKKNLDKAHRAELEVDRHQRWLVSSPRCHIPVLEAWDKSIEGYVSRKSPLNCSALLSDIMTAEEDSSGPIPKKRPEMPFPSALSYVRSNKLYFTDDAVEWGALSAGPKLGECCFRRVNRAEANDDDLEWGQCEPIFGQGLYVNSSVIEVNCVKWNYTNVHSFVVHNQEEEEALVRVASAKLNPDRDFYSVLMLGVDTISRLNGQRQLNKTLQTLKDLYNTLEFVGYNKVAENTFPNLIPLLTGLRPEQLAEIQCWQSANYSQENEVGKDYLDNCKFLWNFYQQAGYLTYISEDWPQASTFNYLKPGFKYQPSTFYGRPFTLARDKLVFPKFNSPGCASCQLDRPLVDVDISNLRAFIENNTNRLPYFALHWINCPQHDDLNGASQFDHILEQFFRSMRDQFEADRTFVVFFSDHGYRWNDFVSTRVGHYESSLPLLTIAPPRDFIERHPDLYERMRSHQNALLTPFDMFHTLIDLKNLGTSKSRNTSQQRDSPMAETPRGRRRSSFVDESMEQGHKLNMVTIADGLAGAGVSTVSIKQLKLPDGVSYKQKFTSFSLFESHSADQLDRGCIEAGIPDNYCVCHQFEPVAANRTDILGAVYYLVYVHLEARLQNHLDICQRLDLERVHHAEMFNLEKSTSTKDKTSARRRRRRRRKRSQVIDEDKQRRILTSPRPAKHLHGANDDQNKHDYLPNREYSIMFSTKPGGGLFQEVVRFYGSNMTHCELEIDKTRTVIEDDWASAEDKHESVLTMNDVCDFSVHSESLSRFNLYKDQSKCVKSNIELKKICYCKDLTSY